MSEEKYELTVFDLEENKQYEALQGDLKWPVYRKGGWIYHSDDTAFQLLDHGDERFREIKPKKKLYAYLNMSTVAMFGEIYSLLWSEDHSLSETRMPELDQEIS